MAFSRMLRDDLRPIIILLVVFLLLRLPLLSHNPLIKDEAVYAVMIEEQREELTLIPTFLGYPVSWKPPLFFWVYSLFPHLPGPMELTYRLPSLLFGLAALVPLFLLLRNAGCSRATAFISLLIFQFSYITSYPNTALLIDSLLFLQIALSLYLYSEQRLGRWRFIAAGALVFTSYFTKLAVAAMAPLLAIAYFLFLGKRETLRDPLFLLSLLAVPAAALCTYAVFQSAGLGEEMHTTHLFHRLLSDADAAEQVWRVWSGFSVLLLGAGIWFSLSVLGFIKYWRENGFMSVWYLLTLFPLLGSFFMPWYFLPVMPAICYFASLVLLRDEGRERTDLFFTAFLAFALAASAAGSLFIYHTDHNSFINQKEAGLLAAGKDNVLFIGNWAPGAISYKMAEEIRSEGSARDFGWVLFMDSTAKETFQDFIEDYRTGRHDVAQGSFTGLYSGKGIYRKDTSIESFEYIVLSDSSPGGEGLHALPGAACIYNRSGILVFRMDR